MASRSRRGSARGARDGRRALGLALLVTGTLVVTSLTACGGDDDGGGAPVSAATTTSSTSASPSTAPSAPSPTPTQVGPTPTPGPSVVPKVKRPGQPSRPTVSASPEPFDAAVSYPDGVSLSVDGVTSGIETGTALGQFAGREYAVFAVTLKNGSSRPLDLQSVVVTATYGAKNLVAERVYADGSGAVDFGGSLPARGSAQAKYVFAVPKASLRDARLVVDFDGVHTSAEFRGDARRAG